MADVKDLQTRPFDEEGFAAAVQRLPRRGAPEPTPELPELTDLPREGEETIVELRDRK